MTFKLRGKRVLVTGATGLIGESVARRLLTEGAHVRALVRRESRIGDLPLEPEDLVEGDVRDLASLRRAVQGCQIVFHFAGLLIGKSQASSAFQSVNVEGTRNLAEIALEAKVERFIHASAVAVYGLKARENTDERSRRLLSGEPYSDSKVQAEEVIRQFIKEKGLPCVIIQPAEVYGPGDETLILRSFRLLRSRRMIVPAGQSSMFHPIYIDDLVDGVLAAFHRGKVGEAYILAGPEAVTTRTFFGYLAQSADRKWVPSVSQGLALKIAAVVEFGARVLRQDALFTRNDVLFVTRRATYDTRKARWELGFVPVTDVATGMRLIDDWLKDTLGSGVQGSVRIQTKVMIDRPLETVFEFVTDRENAPKWALTILEAQKLSDGPVSAGTRFRELHRFLGMKLDFTFEVTEHRLFERSLFESRSGPMTIQVSYTFEPSGDGTDVALNFEGRPGGAVRFVKPLASWMARKQWQRNLSHLKERLEDRS